jgi:hypothetical protein
MAIHIPKMPTAPASGTLMLPRKSDIASPMPVVRSLSTQNMTVISGTFAASGCRRSRVRARVLGI